MVLLLVETMTRGIQWDGKNKFWDLFPLLYDDTLVMV